MLSITMLKTDLKTDLGDLDKLLKPKGGDFEMKAWYFRTIFVIVCQRGDCHFVYVMNVGIRTIHMWEYTLTVDIGRCSGMESTIIDMGRIN